MPDTRSLQNLLLARLAKKGDAAARAEITAGTYTVDDFTVTVKGGTVEVGEDEPYTPTASIPLIPTLTIALHRAGFQREAIAQIFIDAASTAINNGGKVGDEMEATIAYLTSEVKALQSKLSEGLPQKTRKGKVKVAGRIE